MQRATLRMLAIAALATVGLGVACSSFESDNVTPEPEAGAPDGGSDAAPDAATASDANHGGPRTQCRWDAPFGPPLKVFAVNATADDATPRPSDDELTMYFRSLRTGVISLYVARRASRSDSFGAPAAVPLAPDAGRANASFDGNASGPLFFQQFGSDGLAHLSRADRTADGGFLPTVELEAVRPFGQTFEPFVRGNELLFTAQVDASTDFFRTTILADGGLTEGSAVSELNTPFNEYLATPSHDGETIYFASTRDDAANQGGTDIWRARRDAGGKFSGSSRRSPS